MPEVAQPLGLRRVGDDREPGARPRARRGSRSDVGRDVLRARLVERFGAAFVPAVGPQPVAAAREQLVDVDDVVEQHHDPASASPVRTRRATPRHRAESADACGDGRSRPSTTRVSAAASFSDAGTRTSTKRGAVDRDRTSSQRAPSHCAIPNGRLSSSSLARTTLSTGISGRSSSDANTGPAAGTATSSSSASRVRRTGRAPRRPARSAGARAVARAQRRRPLDEHVAQRGEALGLGAPDVAREPAAARTGLDDEERIRTADRATSPVERTRRRTRRTATRLRATSRSRRPARPAPWPRAKNPSSGSYERALHEHVERDRSPRDGCAPR